MVIISIVKSSLALSLGLVGALSIIRFRTAIKEPEELVFLFIAITIGLGLGANQVKTVVLAFILIIGFIVLTRNLNRTSENSSLFLTISSEKKVFNINNLSEIVSNNCSGVKLKRYDIINEKNNIMIETVFQISVNNINNLQKLQFELENIDPNVKVSIIDEAGIIL